MPNELISCPECQRSLRVPPDLLGKDVRCPSCNVTFVAEPSGAAPPQVEEADEGFREAPRPSRRREEDDDDETQGAYEEDLRHRRRRDYVPHRGPLILTLGILSLVMCGVLTGIPAWVMGNNDLQAMRAGKMDPDGEGLTKAGRICGMVSVGLLVIGCLFWGMMMMLGTVLGAVR